MLIICEYAIAYAIVYFAKTHMLHVFLHIIAFSESHMRKLCCICKNTHICHIFPHIRSHFQHFPCPTLF